MDAGCQVVDVRRAAIRANDYEVEREQCSARRTHILGANDEIVIRHEFTEAIDR